MGNPGGKTDQNRAIKLFAQRKGGQNITPALLGIGRFQQRNFRRQSVIPGILFILGTVHTGVVGHHDHQSAVDPGVREGKEGIRRHIQAHMFHGTKYPCPPDRRTGGHFQGDLFIGRPLAVNLLVAADCFRNFRTRCPGIRRGYHDPGFISPPGYRFVTKHEFFHKKSHLEPVFSVSKKYPTGGIALQSVRAPAISTAGYCLTPVIFYGITNKGRSAIDRRKSFSSGYLISRVPVGCGWNLDRKSTRLNSSHVRISYAVFCLKKKKNKKKKSSKIKKKKKKKKKTKQRKILARTLNQ